MKTRVVFNGGEVLADQFTKDPLYFPFQGEPGIAYRNITTAIEQPPTFVLTQVPPASGYGKENNIADGDYVIRDADAMSNYRIVTKKQFEDGTADTTTEAVRAEEQRARDTAALSGGHLRETPEEKVARLRSEAIAIDDALDVAERELAVSQGQVESLDEKRARLKAELDALG